MHRVPSGYFLRSIKGLDTTYIRPRDGADARVFDFKKWSKMAKITPNDLFALEMAVIVL